MQVCRIIRTIDLPAEPIHQSRGPKRNFQVSETGVLRCHNCLLESSVLILTMNHQCSIVTLPIHPADSILSLKNLLSSQSADSSPLAGSAPANQRLLLKGKALLDSKLVKDYEIKDGSVITVMMSAPKQAPPAIQATAAGSADVVMASPAVENSANETSTILISPSLGATNTGHKRRVSDIPAVTLSPAGTPGATTPLLQPTTTVGSADPLAHIPLTPQLPPSPILKSGSIPIDLTTIPIPSPTSVDDSPYHQTLANPQFWKEIRGFLENKFGKDTGGRTGDADKAFEEFLRSAKVNLSPHEIAKIRDEVGISGMGGQ